MVKLSLLVGALFAASATAFAPQGAPRTILTTQSATLPGAEVDELGNNVKVKNLLLDVEQSGLLTKVAQSGLLSKAQEAGVSLSKLEPLLELASKNPDILVLVEASGPELLPILPTVVKLAPSALPLLATLITIPPSALTLGAVLSVGAAAGIVVTVPDDTVATVALQTLAVGVLGLGVPVASLAGAAILGQLTK